MRTKKLFLTNGGAFVLGAALTVCVCGAAEAKPARPNIILMMADDLGWGDTGFNGNTIIQTPHLDQMAKDGAVLNHFYSIGPVCSPTRASFMTGRHYYRHGIYQANIGHLPKEEFTLFNLVGQAGYATGHFGKWHLGTLSRTTSAKGLKRRPEVNYAPPWEKGCDVSFVTESAVQTWNPAQGGRSRNNPYYENGVVATENLEGCDSRVLMDRAIPFIQQAAQQDTPFLAIIWFHAPHAEVVAGPDYLEMYKEYGAAAHYYGCITAMDEQVGRLRNELESLGIADNTALFFCSDNGPEGKTEMTPNKPVKHAGVTGGFTGRKRSLHEGGVRVPGLALWPGKIKAGSQIDVPVSVLDYFPTVSRMTATALPADRVLDGEDVLPILAGQQKAHKRPIPFRHGHFAGLVDGSFKLLIDSPTDSSRDQLFDLSKDKTESNNIASSHPEGVQEMRTHIIKFLASAEQSHHGEEYGATGYVPVDRWIPFGLTKKELKIWKKTGEK